MLCPYLLNSNSQVSGPGLKGPLVLKQGLHECVAEVVSLTEKTILYTSFFLN